MNEILSRGKLVSSKPRVSQPSSLYDAGQNFGKPSLQLLHDGYFSRATWKQKLLRNLAFYFCKAFVWSFENFKATWDILKLLNTGVSTCNQLCSLVIFVESESSHYLVELSQRRVTRTIQWLWVIGLQARVYIESNEIQHCTYDFFTTNWYPTNYKMAFNELKSGVQRATKWCRMLF